jgi:hypothetical protein
LRRSAADWVLVARATPRGAVTFHPQFGELTAVDVMRRNAREAVHHEFDIRRELAASTPRA